MLRLFLTRGVVLKKSKGKILIRYADILLVIITAVLYGLFSFHVIYQQMAGERLLQSYILNVVFIVVGLLGDRFLRNFVAKLQKQGAKSRIGKFFRRAVYVLDFELMSLKSALYLYYIWALIFSKVLILDPDINVSYYFRAYFIFVEYGLALLVAFDKFIDQFDKYVKRRKNSYPEPKEEETSAD